MRNYGSGGVAIWRILMPCIFASIFVVQFVCGMIAHAADTGALDRRLSRLAQDISQELKKLNYSSTTLQVIGSISKPGPGPSFIKVRLAEELEKSGTSVKRSRADVGILCEVNVLEVENELQVSISTKVVDRNDQPINSFSLKNISIVNDESVALFAGSPAYDRSRFRPVSKTSTGGDTLTAAVTKGFNDPNQGVDQGTIARAEPGSLFGLEVLVDGKGKHVSLDNGLVFTDLKDSEEFAIRLYNDATFEVAVELRLDGIHSSHPAQQEFSWLIAPKSSTVIPGWYYGGKDFRAFKIVPRADSIASRIGSTGDIGVITGIFRRSYKENETPDAQDSEWATADSGVGEGKAVQLNVDLQKRKYGRMLAQIPVRYERPEEK